jgi:hypothetical protein
MLSSIFSELNILYLDIVCRLLLLFQHEKHTIKSACKNGLPDDEHKMFETCRRHQEWNGNINLKRVHYVGYVTNHKILMTLG